MTAAASATTNTADRELVIERIINAPRDLVFEAFTDPRHIGEWFGPDGFSTTTYEIDVRPGGMWRYIMHGPDGTNYDNRITYIEIVKPERLIYWHGDDENPKMFHETVTFTDHDGRTMVRMRALFDTAAARDETLKFGAVEGGNQTLARLAAFLEHSQTA